MNSVTFEDILLQSDKKPNVEYLLQGSILDSGVDLLLERLKGLCDNYETYVESFHDLEVCLSMEIPQQQPLNVRVRKALDRDAPCLLRYVGQPEVAGTRPALVRSSIDCGCSATILEFLTELGCQRDFEYISKGIMIRKGRMIITVSRILKNLPEEEPQDLPNALLTDSHLVEVSVITPNADDAIGEEMKAFAEHLKPLINLEKIDYKRISFMSS